MQSIRTSAAAALGFLATAGAAFAQSLPIIGEPKPGGIAFQPAGTGLAREVHDLDHLVLIIITVISIFVTALLLWVAIRYNQRANPKPATFTHNSPLEIAWTIVPILILVVIGANSLPVLFRQMEIPETQLTVKVTGNQWYWNYDYPDAGVNFDSYLIGEGLVMSPEVEGQLVAAGYTKNEFLLATDTALVVPVNTNIKVQITGADVIHAWMVPGLGMQHSAVPGRLGEMWFNADKEGIYFGQCTNICGKNHAYMPITVKVVSQPVYDAWLVEAQAGNYTLAQNSATRAVTVASAN